MTDDTPGPRHALATHGAAAGQSGRVQTSLGRAGQTLEQLRPCPEHVPPIEKVGISKDVRVVQIVVVWPDHFGVVCSVCSV